jgi:hypothetical protein
MADEMKVTLPEGVVKPIIEAQVVAALQGQERLITDMVRFVLQQNVRDQNTYKDYPFLEYTCRSLIRQAVESAVRRWVADQSTLIEQEVQKQLRTQVRGIASTLVKSIADEASSKWRISVGVTIGEK